MGLPRQHFRGRPLRSTLLWAGARGGDLGIETILRTGTAAGAVCPTRRGVRARGLAGGPREPLMAARPASCSIAVGEGHTPGSCSRAPSGRCGGAALGGSLRRGRRAR